MTSLASKPASNITLQPSFYVLTIAMNSFLRLVFLFYFVSHIPITILLDLQIVFGHLYPPQLQALEAWYVTTFNDYLLGLKPIWLQSFIYCEAFAQLPFFFVATYGLVYKKNWIRIPSIVYGAHVATTVVPILAETLLSKTNTDSEKLVLTCFYAPYLIIPAMLALYMCFNEKPFRENQKRD